MKAVTKGRAESVVIPLRISRELTGMLDGAVRLRRFGSRNQLIREALEQFVSQTLESRVMEVREISVEEAAKLIDRYLTSKPGAHYVSELSEELGIELGVAFKAVEKLKEKGIARAR